MQSLRGVGSFTQSHTAAWRETTGPPRSATRLFCGLLPLVYSAPLPPGSFDSSTLENTKDGVYFFIILSQVAGKDVPVKSRNVSIVVFLFPAPSALGCFCSPKLIKIILQGNKNRQLASFLFLSVHFLERIPRSSLIRVGVGQFPTQGTMTQAKPKARSA